MSILVSFFATVFVALAAITVGVPDRWLYPACLVCFVVLAAVLHGADSETHA